jgi:hypothetical protein
MSNLLPKPASVYGSETVLLIVQDHKRIGIVLMRFQTSIVGATLGNKIRNEEIRKRLETKITRRYLTA